MAHKKALSNQFYLDIERGLSPIKMGEAAAAELVRHGMQTSSLREFQKTETTYVSIAEECLTKAADDAEGVAHFVDYVGMQVASMKPEVAVRLDSDLLEDAEPANASEPQAAL